MPDNAASIAERLPVAFRNVHVLGTKAVSYTHLTLPTK